MSTSLSLLCAGLLAMVLVATCQEHSRPNAVEGPDRKINMRIHLELPKTSFVVTEDISVMVSITNTGSVPVSLPDPFHRGSSQPTYSLTGPAFPQGYTFSFRSITNSASTSPTSVEPVLLTLHPGERIEESIPLHSWARARVPGSYRLAARLEWQGISTQSEAVEFTLEPLVTQTASLGLDRSAGSYGQAWLSWLQQGHGGKSLYETTLVEERPELGLMRQHDVGSLGLAGPQAVEVLAPWLEIGRLEAGSFWQVWREGADLAADPLTAPVQRFALGVPPALVVRPALMTASGHIYLLVAASNQRDLVLVRFPAPRGAGSSPAAVERIALAGTVEAARATLAFGVRHNEVHAAVVTHSEGLLMLHHLVWSEARRGISASIVLPVTADLLPSSEPGIWVDPQGGVTVSLLVSNDHRGRTLALAEVSIQADGSAGPVKVIPIGPLPAAVRAATVRYSITPQQPGRRDWVLLLETGELLHSAAPGTPRRTKSPPVLPLELAPLPGASYLVTLHPDNGPGLELLP